MWFLYILKCADSTLYTGITTDISRRIAEHESGKGAKYCRGRTPLTLVFSQEFDNRAKASKAEIMVKKLGKKEKLELIRNKIRVVV